MKPSFAGYRWGLGLTALLFSLLLLNNWQYLFHTPLYEFSDWAANSLFVREAKHHPVLHGHYSRWGFYHPGPVLFYTYGCGEWMFYDLLHLVPTPYNGQVISLFLAMTLFFSLAVSIFAQRLGVERGGYTFFLPLALLFAVWHYGAAASLAPAFTETWPAYPLILVFLCFVVTTASVASGGGRELPLVMLTGGWLVHNHVAQPLFVVPMTLVAYAGLLTWCRGNASVDRPQGRLGILGAGWRAFPRAHVVAGGILALFILPLLVDALHGSRSNFNLILNHMRQPHGPMHGLVRSACYFLTFGSYSTYSPTQGYFGRYTRGGMLDFLWLHWRAYLCWVTALVATPLLFLVARRTESLAPPGATAAVPDATWPRRRSTFLPWFGAMSLLALVLTLFWGMKQDGEMTYFNAYFNYSIYYCAALGLAAALSAFLQAVTASPHLRGARTVLSVALVLGFAVAALSNTGSFRSHLFDNPPEREAARVVSTAAAATLPPGGTCYLDCAPLDAWPITVGVALQLERLGYQVCVSDDWKIMFGQRRIVSRARLDYSKPIAFWSIVPVATDPARLARWPLSEGYGIAMANLADVDPGSGAITFAAGGNWGRFARFGWVPTPGDWAVADQPEAMLQFRPLPLPPDDAGGVDMLVNVWSSTTPKNPAAQRLEAVFNGVALSTVPIPVAQGTTERVKVHVDADRWRDACARGFAEVMFRFPDSRSPQELGVSGDVRRLGGAFRTIEFRLAP